MKKAAKVMRAVRKSNAEKRGEPVKQPKPSGRYKNFA